MLGCVFQNGPSKMIGLFRNLSFLSAFVKSFDAQGNMLSFRCSMGMTEIQERVFDRKIG